MRGQGRGSVLTTCPWAAPGSSIPSAASHKSRRSGAELQSISRSHLQGGMLLRGTPDTGEATWICGFQGVSDTTANIKDPVWPKGIAVPNPLGLYNQVFLIIFSPISFGCF